MTDGDVFTRAKAAVTVHGLAGLAETGARWRRAKRCPLCDGRDDFAYTADRFRCWKCGESGDALTLAALLWSCSPREAALQILGERDGDRQPVALKKPAPEAPAPNRSRVEEIMARAVSPRGTIVETYLRARAIDVRRVAPALEALRFNPSAPWGADPDRRGTMIFAPAMIGGVETARGWTGGLHCTFLRGDGSAKADLSPAKKMFGPQSLVSSAGVATPGGMRLCAPDIAWTPEKPVLVVAEGIESALSGWMILGAPVAGAFAAGSLDRLQGGMMGNAFGRVDWRNPRPDPDRPAATMRWDGLVAIFVDHDMSDLLLEPDTPWALRVPAERRAMVSGLLAAFWWRRAGASDVKIFLPPAGMDVNDDLRARSGGA